MGRRSWASFFARAIVAAMDPKPPSPPAPLANAPAASAPAEPMAPSAAAFGATPGAASAPGGGSGAGASAGDDGSSTSVAAGEPGGGAAAGRETTSTAPSPFSSPAGSAAPKPADASHSLDPALTAAASSLGSRLSCVCTRWSTVVWRGRCGGSSGGSSAATRGGALGDMALLRRPKTLFFRSGSGFASKRMAASSRSRFRSRASWYVGTTWGAAAGASVSARLLRRPDAELGRLRDALDGREPAAELGRLRVAEPGREPGPS